MPSHRVDQALPPRSQAAAPILRIAPYAAPITQTLSAYGVGFAPGEMVNIEWGPIGSPVLHGARADAQGLFGPVAVTAPVSATVGVYPVTAVGVASQRSATFWYVVSSALTGVQAGQLGVNYIAPQTVQWGRTEGCIGCHVQATTLQGLAISTTKGYNVPTDAMTALLQFIQARQEPGGSFTWGYGAPPTQQLSNVWLGEASGYVGASLAAYDQDVSGAAIASLVGVANYLLTIQQSNGAWPGQTDQTILLDGGSQRITANAMATLARAYADTHLQAYETALQAGAAWLKSNTPVDIPAAAYTLIGLNAAGLPASDPGVSTTVASLLATQNSDGGWGNSAGAGSNALGTGMAVYSLRLSGLPLGDQPIARGVAWLIANQDADGSWPVGDTGLSYDVATTMWPVIALGGNGNLGVTVTASPPLTAVAAGDAQAQTVRVSVVVTNTGQYPDTYSVSVAGAPGGWNARLTPTRVSLLPGRGATAALLVRTAVNLPVSYLAPLLIVASSVADPHVSAQAQAMIYTPPVPPSQGDPTTTTIIEGAGSAIFSGRPITFAATVQDNVTGQQVIGPASGTVNFLIAGVAVGASVDPSASGVYSVTWTPPIVRMQLGPQALLATYSGVNRQGQGVNLLPSFALASVTVAAPPQSWPSFGDTPQNTRDNTLELNLTPASAGTLTTTWSTPLGGALYSSPIEAAGTVYIGTLSGQAVALNAQSGAPVWIASVGSAVRASPAFSNGSVYFGSQAGTLDALIASTGMLAWSDALGGAIWASPVVSGGSVHVGSIDHAIEAIDASSGAVLWRTTLDGPIVASPAVDGDILVATDYSGTVYALNAATGVVLWRIGGDNTISASPAIANNRVYVVGEDGVVRALAETTGKLLWAHTFPDGVVASPAVNARAVIVATEGGGIAALNPNTGRLLWLQRAAAQQASPAIAGALVFVAGIDGTVEGLALDNGAVRWTARTSEFVSASPIEVNSTLYVATGGGVLQAFASAGG